MGRSYPHTPTFSLDDDLRVESKTFPSGGGQVVSVRLLGEDPRDLVKLYADEPRVLDRLALALQDAAVKLRAAQLAQAWEQGMPQPASWEACRDRHAATWPEVTG
jgi:hypothetical protein